MKIRKQLEIQAVVRQWIANFIQDNSVDSATMINALNNVVLQLQSELMTDLLVEIQEEEQQQLQQFDSPIQEEEEIDE